MRMNLIGQKYGRLTVISEIGDKFPRMFLCRCDCGKESKVRMGALRSGAIKSCGCLKSERASAVHSLNLTGQRFGRLTAIKIVGKIASNRVNLWLCRCDCGAEVTARANLLINGDSQSCGCLKNEMSLSRIKKGMKEKTVDDVRVPLLTQRLRFDNSSGHKGVSWHARSKSWRATIGVGGKVLYLGSFKDKEAAIAARKDAEEKYHKPYIEKLAAREENER